MNTDGLGALGHRGRHQRQGKKVGLERYLVAQELASPLRVQGESAGRIQPALRAEPPEHPFWRFIGL